jgi:hypothetical protein
VGVGIAVLSLFGIPRYPAGWAPGRQYCSVST